MPIKLYDSKDTVPEPQRANAIETKDGKFAVGEPEKTDSDVATLTSTLQKERDERKKAEDARKLLEKERDDLKLKADAAARGITEAELQKLRDDEAKKTKPIEEERDRLKAENRKLKLDDQVRRLALDSGVMKTRIEKVMRDLNGRVDLTEDGNSIVVLDATGKATTEKIEDFLKTTYKKEAAFFYEGPGGSGGGSDPSGDGGPADGADAARAAGKAAAAAQKKGAADNKLAFT